MSTPTQAPVRDRAITVVHDRLNAHYTGVTARVADDIVDALIAAGVIPATVEEKHRPVTTAELVASRTRVGCPRPDKAAYDNRVPAERDLAASRRRPGMALYRCACKWWHLGNPQPVTPGCGRVIDDSPQPDPPALPEGPIVWAREKRRVVLVNGAGHILGEGTAETYCDSPTLRVRVAGQLTTWRADMTRTAPL